MWEEGIVIAVKGTKLKLRIKSNPACGHCRMCVTSQQAMMITEAENSVGAKVGDKVLLKTPGTWLLKAAFLIYVVPVLSLIMGLVVGITVTGSEMIGGLMGLGCLMLCFTLMHLYDKKVRANDSLRLRILRIVKRKN